MADRKFQAGAATSNITPRLGISINGNMRDGLARHVHDELLARCLVLDDGQTRLAIAVCDSCMIPGDVHQAAKHLAHGFTGIPLDRMLISATHTHSAPASASVFQSDADEEYKEFLAKRIADGIRRAANNLAPAKIGWGSADEPSQVFNRRWRMKPGTIPTTPLGASTDQVQTNPPRASENLVEPAGPIDPQVFVVSLVALDGRPLAALANYSLHYVGGTGPGHLSADYYGFFADRLQELLSADRLDPPFVAMMTNGTSGDINNSNFRLPRPKLAPYAQMRRVADAVAKAGQRAIGSIEYRDWVPLGAAEAQVDVARRLPSATEVQQAKAILAKGKGADLVAKEEIYARETVLMESLPARLKVPVQALRIGELGIAAFPCETFVQTGLAIKQESALKPAFVISLANDYAGYLPTPEHHRLGGYETWRARSSFLEVQAEPKLRAKALELLKKLSEESAKG